MGRAAVGSESQLLQAAAALLAERDEASQQLTMTELLTGLTVEVFDCFDMPDDVMGALRLSGLARLQGVEMEARPWLESSAWTALAKWAQLPTRNLGIEERFAGAHRLGQALDLLMAASKGAGRKRAGSYFTPPSIATHLVQRAVVALQSARVTPRAVLDPACGGGAFLIEAARALLRSPDEPTGQELLEAVLPLHGVDLSELAVAVAEAALTLLAGRSVPDIEQRLVVGDALVAPGASPPIGGIHLSPAPLDFSRAFPQCSREADSGSSGSEREATGFDSGPRREATGFDWVVGNPPWVAFQGRATQKISPELRHYYRSRYEAFTGYATLHGMFVERATELAPRGVVSLLLPSSLADLDGYRGVRRCVLRGHEVEEPLPEYGQDAFSGVVQPCFALVARPRSTVHERGKSHHELVLDRPWTLEERSHKGRAAALVAPPEALARLSELPLLPSTTFREMGFQSNGAVVRELFFKGDQPKGAFCQPLLEGRRVRQFCSLPPRLFVNPDPSELRQRGARFRGPEAYEGVDFLVRQTAAYPIAAISPGLAFRNSLIAGYGGEFGPHLLVALLNSALFRALHLSRTRDARQAAFPQVKLAHLRSLPAPPDCPEQRERIAGLSRKLSQRGDIDPAGREQLDGLVFELFRIDTDEAEQVRSFLRQRAPKALEPSQVQPGD